MTERLNFANAIRARVDARPGYDPRTLGIGQVHIGLGAFHRAHQALYAELALAARPGPWGIAAVSMRSAAARDQLAPQDGLYALAERSGAGETLRLIGCIRRCLVGGEAAIAAIADPAIRIVTLTVTEKGYCHDPASGRLNPSHSALSQGDAASLPGVLTAGLAARRQAGLGPVTVLCCDNLPHNGRVARQVTLDYAARRDDGLAAWIEREIAFPSTMVDRIVPATTDADRARVAARLGFEDRGAVVAEPFRQWVIEDRFAAERPAWEAGGAELVGDVAPYELMKLRLLNAAHSTLAYLGRLLGHDYVHQAIGDRRLRAAVERLWAEAAPTVPVPTADYRRALIERFANPALNHRLLQIAMDGSQKLPQRVLAGLRERLARGEPIDALALTVAGWMRFIVLSDSLDDPLGAELKRRARGTPAEVVSGVLGLAAVFGADLAGAKPLVAATTRWLEALTASPAAALEKGVGHA